MPIPYGSTGAQRFTSAPAVGVAGSTYYDTTLLRSYISDGVQWRLAGEGDGPFLAPVRLVTTGNHGLTGLTAIDGVTPIAGDRIGAFYQTTGSQNGIYVAASGAWTRATDASSAAAFARGMRVWCQEGTQHGGKEFTQGNSYTTYPTDTAQFRVRTMMEGVTSLTYPVPWGHGQMVWDSGRRMIRAWDAAAAAWRPVTGVISTPSSAWPSDITDGNFIFETDTSRAYMQAGAFVVTLTQQSLADMTTIWLKDTVASATTGNITLSGVQTIDGNAGAVNQRVLVKDQTTASQNGIYLQQTGAWTRVTDMDSASEANGAVVHVDVGTVNAGSYWATTFTSANILGTDAMVWNRMGPEVAIQPTQPSSALDLWVDTDEDPPQAMGTLGYAEVTSNPTATSASTTPVDISGLSVTVTLVAGRRIRVTAYIFVNTTVANDRAIAWIREGTTGLEGFYGPPMVQTASAHTIMVTWIGRPSAGAHTYVASVARAVGTGTIALQAGTTTPAWILVEDIGV